MVTSFRTIWFRYAWPLALGASLGSVRPVGARNPADHPAVIDVVETPREPAFLTSGKDGQKVYVFRRGPPIPHRSTGGHGWIDVYRAVDRRPLGSIDLGAGFPLKGTLSPDGSLLYLAITQTIGNNLRSNGVSRVAVIETATDRSLDHIRTPGSDYGASDVAVTPDGSRAFVTIRGSDAVVVIDTFTNRILKWIPIGPVGQRVPTGIAITPDGSSVYVANRKNATLTWIDASSCQVKQHFPLGIAPSTSFFHIEITPDGTRAYVAGDFASPDVAVFDVHPSSSKWHQVLDRIPTGGGQLGDLAITPDGTRAFLTSRAPGDDRFLVLDIEPDSDRVHQVVAWTPVGAGPLGVTAGTAGEGFAWVANREDSTLSVIGAGFLEVVIDVKPDDANNRINPRSHGKIPVAILSSPDLDAVTGIDLSSLTFGATGREARLVLAAPAGDLDGDGLIDLLTHFETAESGFRTDSTIAVLTGRTTDGRPLQGMDPIEVVPGAGRGPKAE